jgi:hypothetical protein
MNSMAAAPRIRGKHERTGRLSFFGFDIVWAARFIQDTEARTPRFVIDEDSVAYHVERYPADEPSLSPARRDELMDVARHTAKKEGSRP